MRAHRLLVAAIVCGLAVQAVSGEAADVLGTKPGHVFFGPSATSRSAQPRRPGGL